MPRLPGPEDVPSRSARGGGGIPRVPQNRTAEGAVELGSAVASVGDKMLKAEKKINERRESLARIRAAREFNRFGQDTLTQISTEQDLSEGGTLNAYGEALSEKKQEILGSFDGSDEGRIRLMEVLEQFEGEHIDRAAVQSVSLQQKMVEQEFGEIVNEISAQAKATPENAELFIARGREIIDREKASMTPELEMALDGLLTSRVYGGIIEQNLLHGDIEAAEEMLNDPVVQRRIGEQEQRRLFDRVVTQKQMLAKGEPLETVSDPTSTTGLRFVPRSQAVGREAPPKAPVVSITEGGEREVVKQLGKLDAERVVKYEEDAQKAFRDLAEVDRMRSAIASGRFRTGVFSDARMFLARFADFVGASEETKNIIGDAATADTLDAASARLAVEAAQKLGRVTNMSLQFIRDSLPQLSRTPEGNKILLEVMERVAQRDIEIASLADEYIRKYNTLRPENDRTFFQALRDLEETDPVITDELRNRIIQGSQSAPPSFREFFMQQLPKDFEVPEGYDFEKIDDEGRIILKDKETGRFIRSRPIESE